MKSIVTLMAVGLCALQGTALKLTTESRGPTIRAPISPLGASNRDPHVPKGLCDNVESLAGYFDVIHGKKYFYWIFESRNNPDTDPVVLWMTGGPGCSGELALFHENGACIINDDHKTTRPNPYSWNKNANVIFIDQPAGVGFSTGTANATDEDTVAMQMYIFLEHFFTANKQLADNGFYIFGESYGGHYVPAVAKRVLEENRKTDKPADFVRIHLKGVGIGNGLTDPLTQYSMYPDYARYSPIGPLVTDEEYKEMKAGWPKCKEAILACQGGDKQACEMGGQECSMSLVYPVVSKGLNHYDIRQNCSKPPMCYDFQDVVDFLGQESVREALGVGDVVWQPCNMEVHSHFTCDYLQDFSSNIAYLLSLGKQVLIYAGEDDFICNYLGNKAWAINLDWPGQATFASAPDLPWLVNSEKAGLVRSHANLTFLQIHEAGHMVPLDQPERSLVMLDTFLSHGQFSDYVDIED